jgi:hypothetical protein
MSILDQPERPDDEHARVLAQVTSGDVSKKPDEETEKEQKALEGQRFKAETEGVSQNIEERKRYAWFFFLLSCAWLLMITAVLMLQGFGGLWIAPFKLSQTTILTLVGSTAIVLLLQGFGRLSKAAFKISERFIWAMVGLTATVLLLQGFDGFSKAPFKLSDTVVLALIGSTTLNVLWNLFVVANYLFPKRATDVAIGPPK